MKSHHKLISFLLLAATAAAFSARADEPSATTPPASPPSDHGPRPAGPRMREHRMKELNEKLQLTAAQKDQIKAIWDKTEEQGRALRADATTAREDRRAKLGELMKATHAQVRAVLTPDQQKTFDAMPAERMGHRGPKPEGDKPADAPPPPQS